MGKNASGMYVIDADYNIVSYNHAAEIIYPELKKGEKCYRCLLHNEEPCESCPVVNGIEGPKNYLEPRRNVLRSIDAVEIPLESGEMEHAMIFSAAEATEEAEPTEEATEEATDDSASDQEAALKSELEKLADNARYSDTYRHLQQIEKLKEEADITEYNDALTGLLDDWKKQYIKYKS